MAASLNIPRRVLILADEAATWKIAGLTQLDRLLLSLREMLPADEQKMPAITVWQSAVAENLTITDARLRSWPLRHRAASEAVDPAEFDLVLHTRLCLFPKGLPVLLQSGAAADLQAGATTWNKMSAALAARFQENAGADWRYLRHRHEIGPCEKALLRHAGKTQDGLASRYLNRPISRAVSRVLLRFPITPSFWSVLICILPLSACLILLGGRYMSFVVGCLLFQLYSILDGCDGEIARAKFLQTAFGRRLDSLCDLVGNMLLALSLGCGLAAGMHASYAVEWFYISEGIAAALCIGLSEGILFVRRSRAETSLPSPRWNGALYQRHHEFLERSGILFLGENFAWWLVQLTKRDMALLGFVVFALAGYPELSLHLLLLVSAISSVLAGNAFLRQPAPAVVQEAS